jgi:hypothetical protein
MRWYWLQELLDREDAGWRGAGSAFSSAKPRWDCTVVAWCVLTDLAPAGCAATGYGLRGWCEQGLTGPQRGGWQWQQTRTTDPARAARIWLALAVTSLWVVPLGSQLETGPSAAYPELPDLRGLLGTPRQRGQRRRTRLFRLGRVWLLVPLITGQPLPQQLLPEPWSEVPQPSNTTLNHEQALSHAAA